MFDFDKHSQPYAEKLQRLFAQNDNHLIFASHALISNYLWTAVCCACLGSNTHFCILTNSNRTKKIYAQALNKFLDDNADLACNVNILAISDFYQLFDSQYHDFTAPHNHLARCIIFLFPQDFYDGSWLQYHDAIQKLPNIPISYIAMATLPNHAIQNLLDTHKNITQHFLKSTATPSAIIHMCNPNTHEFDQDYWLSVATNDLAIHCANDELFRKYAQNSHKNHLPITHTNKFIHKHRRKPIHIFSNPWFMNLDCPKMDSQCAAFYNVIPSDALNQPHQPLAPQPINNLPPEKIFLLADNDFSLLRAVACLQPHTPPSQNLPPRLKIIPALFNTWRAYLCLLSHAKHTPEIDRDIKNYWLAQKWISFDGDSCHLTQNGKNLYPGISPYAPLYTAFQWHHKLLCQSLNAECLGFADSGFLFDPAGKYFLLGDIFYQQHFTDINSEKTILAKSNTPHSAPVWLDALPELLSTQESLRIKNIIAASPKLSIQCNAHATTRLKQICSAFKNYPFSNNTLLFEISSQCAQLWTFAGAHINALCAVILKILAPKLQIHYGNFAILLRWQNHTACSQDKITSRLVQIIASLLSFDFSQQSKNTYIDLAKSWQQQNLFAWLMPLLPENFKSSWLQDEINYLKQFLSNLELQTVQTPKLITIDRDWQSWDKWQVLDNPTPAQNTPTPAPITDQSKKIITPLKAHEKIFKISSKTHATPQIPGIMHTQLPWYYIDTQKDFNDAVNDILKQHYIGLDVETTLYDHKLCLIQIGCRHCTYLIDPFSVDFSGLAQILSHPNITIVIHNAAFEKSVFEKYHIQITQILDTLQLSRKLYGMKIPNGHSLKAVCKREFNLDMDKTCQTSAWQTRPLTKQQLEYGALDAEILIHLYQKLVPTTTS